MINVEENRTYDNLFLKGYMMSFLVRLSTVLAFFLSLTIAANAQIAANTQNSPQISTATDLTQPPEIRESGIKESETEESGQQAINQQETTETAPIALDSDLSAIPEIPIIKVFEGKSDEEVVQLLIEYLENIDTLQAQFYQQAPSGTLSNGKLSLRRPGLLRFEYAPPSPLLIIANGGTVFVRDNELKTTDSYPVRSTPLKFLLRKKIDFNKAKILQVDRGSDAAAITIAANDDDDETQGELTLVFSAPEIELIRWVVRDARNGLTIIDLDNVVRDKKLNNGLFRIPETKSPFLKD